MRQLVLASLTIIAFNVWGLSRSNGPLPLDLSQSVLGPSCHLFAMSAVSLPCQAAQLSLTPQRSFVASVFLGEQFQRVNSYRKDIENEDELALVDKLFEESQPLQLEIGASLWLRTEYFSFTYVPLQMSYYSSLVNTAYPIVDIDILLEKSLRLQTAFPLEIDEWTLSAGVLARGVRRQYIDQEIALFDALTDPKLIDINKSESFYLEPGIVLQHKSKWRPRVSTYLQNLKVYHSGDPTPAPMSHALIDTGIAASPWNHPQYGIWDVGINYRHDRFLEKIENQWQVATSYSLGLMSTSASYSSQRWAVGVVTSFLSAKTGVSFIEQELPEWNGQIKKHRTVNLEFGLVF